MTMSRAFVALPMVAVLATGQSFASSEEQFLLEQGTELYKAQKYNEAIAQFEQLLDREPTNWTANYLTALSCLSMYQPGSDRPDDKEYAEKGTAAFERTFELAPPGPEDREKAEKCYLSFLNSIGDMDKAIAYLEKQLATRPNELALMNRIAALYLKKGDFTKALEYFERRAIMDRTNKEAWYTLGVNCWARSYHGGLAVSQEERDEVVDKGIQALETALAIDQEYFDAISYVNLLYRERAKMLAAAGRNADAQQALDKADEYQNRAIYLRNKVRAAAALH